MLVKNSYTEDRLELKQQDNNKNYKKRCSTQIH